MLSLKSIADIFKPKIVKVEHPKEETRDFRFSYSGNQRFIVSIQDASATIRYFSLLGFRHVDRATYLAVIKIVQVTDEHIELVLETSYEMGFYDNLPDGTELPLFLYDQYISRGRGYSHASNQRWYTETTASARR